jgi:acetylornithine deacetylase
MAAVYDSFVSRGDDGARAVDLLERLVSIPSVTGSEAALIDFLEERFRQGFWKIRSIPVSPGRRNILIHRARPQVVLTTHADTVPGDVSPRRQGDLLCARGACDAKASLAAMAVALDSLGSETEEIGMLIVVGEEKGSDGALAANLSPPEQVRYLIGGEPTHNRFIRASKGCLRVRAQARGTSGHSSKIEPGQSAIESLLDFLGDLRRAPFPSHPLFGPTTMNIGTLEGGSAPNVVAANAGAEILFRSGARLDLLLDMIQKCARDRVRLDIPYRSEPIFFRVPSGAEAPVVSFACDLPLLAAWGEPLLIGPGSIEDAHTSEEKVSLAEVEAAVGIYRDAAAELLHRGDAFLEPRKSAD